MKTKSNCKYFDKKSNNCKNEKLLSVKCHHDNGSDCLFIEIKKQK